MAIVRDSSPVTDLDDDRLDPWRPDPSVVARYISRTLPGGYTDTDFLLGFFERRAEAPMASNLMLVGDTQSGKTMLVHVLAVLAGRSLGKEKPLPVFTLSGSSGVTDFDLFGQPTIRTDPDTGRETLVDLPGVVEMVTWAGGILYLDEINHMSERVTSSLHPVADDRRMFINRNKAVTTDGVHFQPDVRKLPEDAWIVGTINPAGYRGTTMLNEAFTQRFTWVPWDYDEEVEAKLVPYQSVRNLGEVLRLARGRRAIHTPVGTSALQKLCDHMDRFGVDTALWMFLGMFQPSERDNVETLLTDNSVIVGLHGEVTGSPLPGES